MTPVQSEWTIVASVYYGPETYVKDNYTLGKEYGSTLSNK